MRQAKEPVRKNQTNAIRKRGRLRAVPAAKRRRTPLRAGLLCALCLLLCGCGKDAEAQVKAAQDRLNEAERLCFTAAVTADLGTERFSCTLEVGSSETETTITVIEPEALSGVRARWTEDGAALEYEDLALSLGTILNGTTGPVEAMPMLCAILRGGHIIHAWTERDGETALLAADYYQTDEQTWTVWFDANTLAPVHAALRESGRTTVSCEIGNRE